MRGAAAWTLRNTRTTFWALENHWQHALGPLPYVLFLTCPLMHLFMHPGHHDHGGRGGAKQPDP